MGFVLFKLGGTLTRTRELWLSPQFPRTAGASESSRSASSRSHDLSTQFSTGPPSTKGTVGFSFSSFKELEFAAKTEVS